MRMTSAIRSHRLELEEAGGCLKWKAVRDGG